MHTWLVLRLVLLRTIATSHPGVAHCERDRVLWDASRDTLKPWYRRSSSFHASIACQGSDERYSTRMDLHANENKEPPR